MKIVTEALIDNFKSYLINEEKSSLTVEKYIRDITFFMNWTGGRDIKKTDVMEYKKHLMDKYSPSSINSMLSSINSFFSYMKWYECKVKTLKIQRQIFSDKNKELTKEEYERLLNAAKKNERLYLLMQTICSTGIRISELKYITVEAIRKNEAIINCKGKMRIVLLSGKLSGMLKSYAKKNNIDKGAVFVTKNGIPLDRSNVWKMLKSLCKKADVKKCKVFPHNFRHLFARTYYRIERDVVRLADILGHSSINTTRIYIMETDDIYRGTIRKLGLLRC